MELLYTWRANDSPTGLKVHLDILPEVGFPNLETSMGEVAVGDLIPGLDILLRKENLDFQIILQPMSSIGNAGMVHSGQSVMQN